MKQFLSIIDWVSDWSGKVVSYAWVVVMMLIVIEVILRYVFVAPTIWTFETILFLCGMAYVIGGAYTLYHRKHIKVDIVYSRFSPRMRAAIDLITFPIFLLFVGILLYTGWDRAWGAVMIRETAGTAWNPPIYPILMAIPLGALLILLQGAANFIRDLNLVIRGRQL